MTKIKLVQELGYVLDIENATNVVLEKLQNEGHTIIDVKSNIVPTGALYRGTVTITYNESKNET